MSGPALQLPATRTSDAQTPAAQTPAAQTPDAQPPAEACSAPCRHPEAVAHALAALPSPAQVEQAAALLRVVADPTRLRLLSALNAAGPGGELCVCDLAAVIGLSESAVSHQLRLLRGVRAVQARREGRVVYYRLLDAHLTALIGSALDHAAEEGGPD